MLTATSRPLRDPSLAARLGWLIATPLLLLAAMVYTGFDPRLADDTVTLLCRDAAARNSTLLVSLHSVELALAHFPRLIGLRDGKVMFDLPRSEVSPALLEALYAGDTPPERDDNPATPLPRVAPC